MLLQPLFFSHPIPIPYRVTGCLIQAVAALLERQEYAPAMVALVGHAGRRERSFEFRLARVHLGREDLQPLC